MNSGPNGANLRPSSWCSHPLIPDVAKEQGARSAEEVTEIGLWRNGQNGPEPAVVPAILKTEKRFTVELLINCCASSRVVGCRVAIHRRPSGRGSLVFRQVGRRVRSDRAEPLLSKGSVVHLTQLAKRSESAGENWCGLAARRFPPLG